MKRLLCVVPIPMAGVVLGLVSLGNLLQGISEGLRLFCGAFGFLLLLLVLGKLLCCPEATRKDLEDPVIASVSATICMSVMQLSNYVYPALGVLALAIWGAAVLAHMGLIVFYTRKFLFRFRLREVFPTCFITYVGIVVASVTSAAFHLQWLGRGIFWFGCGAYLLMFVLVTTRYCRHEVHEAAKPLLCIYAAPMSLTLTGYLSVMEEKNLWAMLFMEVLAQLLYLVVLTQLPRLLRLPFYPSYAAFTFPLVITAFALQKLIAHLQGLGMAFGPLNLLMQLESLIAVVMVGYTVVRYVGYLFGHWARIREEALVAENDVA